MKKTFVYDPEQAKMVELQRAPAPLYTGTHIDPTSVDAAMPRALRNLCNDDRYRNMSAKQLANSMGFNSLETVKRTWAELMCLTILFFCFGGWSQVPPYITPGVSLVDGQRLTAAQAMNLVSGASIGYGFYSTATGEASLNNGDQFLVLTSGNQFRRISAVNAFLNNTNWYANLPLETNVSTNAFVAVWDGGATGQLWRFGASNFVSVNSILPAQSNWNPNLLLGGYDATTGLSWSQNWLGIGSNWINWLPFTNNPGATTNGITNFVAVNDGDLMLWHSAAGSSNGVTSFKTLKYAITNSAVVASERNLKIIVDASLDPTIATITADEVVLKAINTNALPGSSFIAKNLNVFVHHGVTYINPNPPWRGDDTNNYGIFNPWYYVWVISDGTNTGAVLSTNPIVPIPPANVIYGAMVGALGTGGNGNDNFPASLQIDRQVYLPPTNLLTCQVTNYYTALTGFQAGVKTNLTTNFNWMIPPIAKTVSGVAGSMDTAVDAGLALSGQVTILPGVDTNFVGEITIRGAHSTTLFNGFTFSSPFTLPVDTTSIPGTALIWWKSVSGTTTNRVVITGYSL